jgi:hypothetical protein
MGRTAKQVLQSQESGLRVQKDRVQCMGNAWVMGHDCNIPAIRGPESLPPGVRYSSVRHDLRTSGRVGRPFFGKAKVSTFQMRSELHQIAAGRRVGRCTVHAGPSHRWQTSLQPMETTSCVREAERVARASNRMRRSRSAVDRRERFEGT